jgi:hypothetical protein
MLHTRPRFDPLVWPCLQISRRAPTRDTSIQGILCVAVDETRQQWARSPDSFDLPVYDPVHLAETESSCFSFDSHRRWFDRAASVKSGRSVSKSPSNTPKPKGFKNQINFHLIKIARKGPPKTA